MESDVFHTLLGPSQGLFKAKGSKHLGFVFPVASEAEVSYHLAALKQQYHDARHHAYAFRLGHGGEQWRASDDGEPSNSAGPPILGALRSYELTWTLGVVVRYFGGTKLGVSGLIEAYREATIDAIRNGTVLQKFITVNFVVACPYDLLGPIMSVGERFNATIADQSFTDRCTVEMRVRQTRAQAFEQEVKAIYGCTITTLPCE